MSRNVHNRLLINFFVKIVIKQEFSNLQYLL